MKKLTGLLIAVAFLATTSSVSAEGSYFGVSAGLQSNLANLGGTISLDGLSASVGNASMANSPGTARFGGCTLTTGAAQAACYQELPGDPQDIIPPENELISLSRGLPVFHTDANGPMMGLVLEAFWEMEGEATFFRAGVQYTDKVMGGQTNSSVYGIEWLNITWDYYAWTLPVYYGVKAKIGESGAVYGALGVNYTYGGWNLGGNNLGDIPTTLTSRATGSHTIIQTAADGSINFAGGSVFAEAVKFRVGGVGWNALIGVESKLASGNKIFFEVEHIVNGGYDVIQPISQGGRSGFASDVTYPIVTGGTKYKFGWKLPM